MLLRLADEINGHILYIAMLTDHEPDTDVDSRAWNYFRNLNGIKNLDSRIDFCDAMFSHDSRGRYFAEMQRRIAKSAKPVIVFLDPDTGIAPQKATGDHVTIEEVQCLWSCLSSGDVLVIYQHKDRTADSFSRKKKELENALSNLCTLHAYKDVAFLVSKR